MNLGDILFNPIALVKNRELIPYYKHWFHYRVSRKINFMSYSKNPFESRQTKNTDIDLLVYNQICNALNQSPPPSLMLGRYGSTECQAMRSVLLKEAGIQDYIETAYEKLCVYSGFFQNHLPNPTKRDKEKYLKKFTQVMIRATQNCDVFGTWNGALGFEEYFIHKYAKPNIILTDIGFFGPNVHQETPFTYALKNTKVLVVHPFAQTIQNQYLKFDKLFKNKKVLPNFQLQTFKAVQTLHQEKDNRFLDWFEALEWMSNEISKINFDIALIGCGAYGFPLASNIKNMGKIAIHCGGALQLLFGIKGKRWEIEQKSIGDILFNRHWVYPSQEETIKDALKIEGGCYW